MTDKSIPEGEAVKSIVRIPLTPEQAEPLRKFWRYNWDPKNPKNSIFMLLSSVHNGTQTVDLEFQVATLPHEQAKKVVNLLRQYYGEKPYPLSVQRKKKNANK